MRGPARGACRQSCAVAPPASSSIPGRAEIGRASSVTGGDEAGGGRSRRAGADDRADPASGRGRGQPQGDELHRIAPPRHGRRSARAPRGTPLRAGARLAASSVAIVHRHRQLEPLADVAQVGRPLEPQCLPRVPIGRELRHRRRAPGSRRPSTRRGRPRRTGGNRSAPLWRSWSAKSSPNAENSPGEGGTSTRDIPSSRAMPTAWTGPLPPKAIRMNARAGHRRAESRPS